MRQRSFRAGCTKTAGAFPQDDAEAAKWFRLAAAQGDAEAQHNLGVMYDNVSSSIFREWSRRKPRPLELRNRE